MCIEKFVPGKVCGGLVITGKVYQFSKDDRIYKGKSNIYSSQCKYKGYQPFIRFQVME